MTEQEKHNEIRELLRRLDNVRASDDFEKKLSLRIVEEEHRRRDEHVHRYGSGILDFFHQLLSGKSNTWLVPATGFVVLLFFVFYMVYNSRFSTENMTKNEVSQMNTDSAITNMPAPVDLAQTENQNKLEENSNLKTVPEFQSEMSSKPESKQNRTGKSSDYIPEETKMAIPEPSIENKSAPKINEAVPESNTGYEKGEMPKKFDAREETAPVESDAEGMIQEKINTATTPEKRESTKSKTDSAKSSLRKKLEKLDKKWLEEIEEKVNDK